MTPLPPSDGFLGPLSAGPRVEEVACGMGEGEHVALDVACEQFAARFADAFARCMHAAILDAAARALEGR